MVLFHHFGNHQEMHDIYHGVMYRHHCTTLHISCGNVHSFFGETLATESLHHLHSKCVAPVSMMNVKIHCVDTKAHPTNN